MSDADVLAAIRPLLEQIEWGGEEFPDGSCPSCGGYPERVAAAWGYLKPGHFEGCELAAALGQPGTLTPYRYDDATGEFVQSDRCDSEGGVEASNE